MPAFNSEKYIAEAIQSVLDQDYENFELLIINDGSVDNTENEIRRFTDSRIRYFKQENRGVSVARNVGLENMDGDFFCFLDSDDKLPPNSLNSRLLIFEKNDNIEFVDGVVELWDCTFHDLIETKKLNFSGNPFYALCQIDNSCFFGPTWMIKRIAKKEYKFKEGLSHGEDLLFYLTISKNGELYEASGDVVYQYRTGNESAMKDLDGLWNGYKSVYLELKNCYPQNRAINNIFKRKITSIMIKSFLTKGQIFRSLKVLYDFASL
ncbi:MAG: glycosyltransferase [Cyclobacteriaceae bacterium]